MTKAKAIKVVDVEQVIEPEIDPVVETVIEPVIDSIIETVVKPKPKRQPRAKKVETIPEVIPEVIEPVIPEVIEPIVKPVIEKVQCPDCQKMVSSKSLKYSHKHTCIAKKVKEHIDKTEVKHDEIDVLDDDTKVYEPVIVKLNPRPVEKETQRVIRQKIKQENILNLFAQAV